jgi:hypothetical protein
MAKIIVVHHPEGVEQELGPCLVPDASHSLAEQLAQLQHDCAIYKENSHGENLSFPLILIGF